MSPRWTAAVRVLSLAAVSGAFLVFLGTAAGGSERATAPAMPQLKGVGRDMPRVQLLSAHPSVGGAGLSPNAYTGYTTDSTVPALLASLAGHDDGVGEVRFIAPPGTRWSYSEGGYEMLQLMIDDVTGRSFAEYMRDEVLVPLEGERRRSMRRATTSVCRPTSSWRVDTS